VPNLQITPHHRCLCVEFSFRRPLTDLDCIPTDDGDHCTHAQTRVWQRREEQANLERSLLTWSREMQFVQHEQQTTLRAPHVLFSFDWMQVLQWRYPGGLSQSVDLCTSNPGSLSFSPTISGPRAGAKSC
jgi:hypothetical protein